MKSDNKKSSGSILLIVILIILAGFFFFKVDLKGLFESKQFKDNVAYLESKTSGFFNFFAINNPLVSPTANNTSKTNQPLTFPSIDLNAMSKMFQVPSFNSGMMAPTGYPQVPQPQTPMPSNNPAPTTNQQPY